MVLRKKHLVKSTSKYSLSVIPKAETLSSNSERNKKKSKRQSLSSTTEGARTGPFHAMVAKKRRLGTPQQEQSIKKKKSKIRPETLILPQKSKLTLSPAQPSLSCNKAKISNQKKQKKKKNVNLHSEMSADAPHHNRSVDSNDQVTQPAMPEPAAPSGLPDRLTVSGGFSWDSSSWTGPTLSSRVEAPADESSSDDEEQKPPAKLSRQQLRARAAAAELELQQRETRLLDPDRAPETDDDHERLVVVRPDDSDVWIRYMAYFLQATEIEKARSVARRAVKTINFRAEEEKLNVYVAWLNLESMHGTQETLSNVLHEALQANDTFKVYTRMAEIHTANNNADEAERMYGQLVRKLSASKDAWLRYGVFLVQDGRPDAARSLMQRALKCLDKRDHVEVISKFAQLEFRFGDAERGRTMFDHLLASYPKRLDQWNVYVNQLIKCGDLDAAREVFRRAETVHFNARRMRSLLKRHLEFEETHGTAAQCEEVRETARRFVESRSDADEALLDSVPR